MTADGRSVVVGLSLDARLAAFSAARLGAPAEFQPQLVRIVEVVCEDPETLLPNLRKRTSGVDSYANAWVSQYCVARQSSTATRKSAGVSTVPDPVVDALLIAALHEYSTKSLVPALREGHRMAMEAENLIGTLLEEYLDARLGSHGWVCCWGATVRSVDFIGPANELLQVKNRSNSENSSSSRVRRNTSIKKWHRLNASTGATNWSALGAQTRVAGLTEQDFREFAAARVRENPAALYVPGELRYTAPPGGRTT